MTHKLYLCIAATVLLNLSNAVKVSDTVCTKGSGTECTTIGHAECNNAASNAKCKCSDGYKEDSGDGSTCVKVKVSDTVCTKGSGTECTTIGHAECNNAASNAKCKCSDGYKEDSGDGSTCVKVLRVTETVCTKNTGTECTTIGHAECDNADSSAKCKCSAGYKEGSGDGNTCVKAKVSETTCTKDTGTECSAIGHAVCNNAVSSAKCKCSDGYKEGSGDGSTCVKVPRVSETTCTKDTGTECSGIGHAVCNNAVSSAKCKCSDGYKEGSGDGSTCVKVFESACTGTTACTGDANSVCKALTCACKNGFAEKNDVCTKTVSGTVCTTKGVECKTITNAECDTTAGKCKCSPGFTMNVDACAAENAAATISVGGITLALYGFLAVLKILG